MKLNIEELAREAGFKSRDGRTRVQHSNGSFVVVDGELEAFARLIVERCATICDGMMTKPPADDPEDVERGYNAALRRSAECIRNLLEAE